MTDQTQVGVIGATSLVGKLVLEKLILSNSSVVAFSRNKHSGVSEGVEWREFDLNYSDNNLTLIENWICVAPVWVLPEHFHMLQAYGAQRIIVLSSTSQFTKVGSTDLNEQEIASKLMTAEKKLSDWSTHQKVKWIILRPTLIYGLGVDKNISEIARFIRRFSFFPLLGKAEGLRQPIHADDVANACIAALLRPGLINRAYNLSGGETLTYREMVARVFSTLGARKRFVSIPIWIFKLAIIFAHLIPRYRNWSAAMAERMNQDLVFDHTEAELDLEFKPRKFQLLIDDLPK